MASTALITGAYGYLGSLLRARLEAAGWQTVALVRSPRRGDRAVRWRLGEALPAGASNAEALVHCAYDFSPRAAAEVDRINVRGTEDLLRSAAEGDISRPLVLSSMSAYEGTDQIYGRAKLAIEAKTVAAGGIAIRPGLVYGPRPGGMAATLVKLAKLPVVPDLGPSARQFPVHEDDLAGAVVNILAAPGWMPETFGVAQPQPIGFRTLMTNLLGSGESPRFVRTPWRAVYAALRFAELLRLSPVRADSVLGLVCPAPGVPRSRAFPNLLSELRTMQPVLPGAGAEARV
ncbi:MAG TPA: NAD-dependent epimerase/dehydratase family protein [Solirubrobacterales bacterium]|jgi:nucleoside-diphosphate-sugar epimerase|nr:NAD-dependent epimerase/dehydratase family protein [Solirubrobacterales bacterium]